MAEKPNEKQIVVGGEEVNELSVTEEEVPMEDESYEGSSTDWESDSASGANSSSQSGRHPSQLFDPSVKPISFWNPILVKAKRSITPRAQISKKQRRAADKCGRKKDLFIRIWSKEDELALLQGILDYKKHHNVVPFTKAQTGTLLESVKGSLSIHASLNQITEKVRRMKRRYNATSERLIRAKNPNISDVHKAAVFDLSKKVWESLDIYENKIDLGKLKNISKEKVNAQHFAEDYPYLHRHVEGEHSNNALLMESYICATSAEELNRKCNKLEMIEIDLKLKKMELLPSALKLIKDALAKCG